MKLKDITSGLRPHGRSSWHVFRLELSDAPAPEGAAHPGLRELHYRDGSPRGAESPGPDSTAD
jgi:hypothetical protein